MFLDALQDLIDRLKNNKPRVRRDATREAGDAVEVLVDGLRARTADEHPQVAAEAQQQLARLQVHLAEACGTMSGNPVPHFISQHLEKLRKARQTAQETQKASDWQVVQELHQELLAHSEGYLWSLLATIKAREAALKAIEARHLVKDLHR